MIKTSEMGKTLVIIAAIFLQGTLAFCQTNQKDIPVLKGPYLGQNPPGLTPEIFAPGIVSSNEYGESNCLVWDNGNHILFSRIGGPNGGILDTEFVKGKWRPLKQTEIFGGIGCFEPGITPDGKKIFFNSFKEKPQGAVNNSITWVIEKKKNGWSEPQYSEQGGMFPSIDKFGNIYATGRKEGKSCIVKFPFNNGNYLPKEILPPPAFTKYQDMHPSISPDGSYLIFDSDDRKGLFLTFNINSGGWTEPINLSDHLKISGALARISSDGKYIFFQSAGDIYWVSTKIIEELKPTELK